MTELDFLYSTLIFETNCMTFLLSDSNPLIQNNKGAGDNDSIYISINALGMDA
jgi:hypothetical protein